MTLVSAIVPVYGVALYLPRCVDSLLAQTHRDLEVILVDDGSVDGSGELSDRYSEIDHRVRAVHRHNGGLSAARNSGLEVARGEYVVFVDGDDWVDEDMVESLLAAAVRAGADVVVAGFHLDVHDSDDHLISTERRLPRPMEICGHDPLPRVDQDLLNYCGYAWNKLYRRELIKGSSFPEGVSVVEDIMFNAAVLSRAYRVVFTTQAFVHYVQRPRATLGTEFQPRFGSLVAGADNAVRGLLTSWGVSAEQVESAVLESAYGRTQWALRGIVLNGRTDSRIRRAQMKSLLQDEYVRQTLRSAVGGGRAVGAKRPVVWSQAHGLTWPTYVLYALRKVLP